MTATFHKIDTDSPNAITSAIDLFSTPSTNVSIARSQINEILTLNPVSVVPLHFKLHTSNSYLDLNHVYLQTELRIRKQDPATGEWVNLVDAVDNNVSVCQAIGLAMWKNIRVSLNGTQIYEGNSLQAYKSYIDFNLSYPDHVKNGYLNVCGWYPDDGDSQLQGAGHEARRQLFRQSKTAQFVTKLNADIFNQPKFLVNQCELDIELLQADDDFLIVAPAAVPGTRYRLEILTAKLYVKKVDLMDSLAYDLSKKLELHPARYAYKKSSIKSLFISQGRTEFVSNLWSDQVPNRICCALVTNQGFIGSLSSSPFYFQPFDVREISITASGNIYPHAPYNLSFRDNRFSRAYHDFQDALGYADAADGNSISMRKYAKGGHCFFVFTLTPSLEDSTNEAFNLIRKGTTIVRIAFNAPVPTGGLVLIALAEMDAMLYLDKNRVVSRDSEL